MPDHPVTLATMRRVDRRIGRPLCALLTALRRVGARRPPGGAPRRILVLKLAEQGATVAAYPALRRATELVGREHVHVAVFAQNRFVLDELGVIGRDQVLTVRTTGAARMTLDLLRLLVRARRLRIDTVVDFEFFSRLTAVLAYLSGASRRAGLHDASGEGPYRGDLFTHRVSANPVQHVSHTFLALVSALEEDPATLPALHAGPWPIEEPPRITPSADELATVRAIVADALGLDPHRSDLPPLVVLNPNTGDLVPLRRWPEARYVELADRLLGERSDIAIVVTGAPDEAPGAEAVVDKIGHDRCASVAGRTTLRQLLVLYHLAEAMVTNDSGPAHYAALTPVDVVALFGPETPAVFGPTSPRSHAVWAGLPCSPCVNAFNNRLSPCRDNVCMQRIDVDQVHDIVAEVLDRRIGPAPISHPPAP